MNSRYLDRDNQPLQIKSIKEMNIEIEVHDPTFEENSDYEDYSIQDHIEAEQNTNDLKLEDEHNVLKRSVCKPHQEFQSECNQCKCAGDGQSYTCTHNECMDGAMDKEVEVFMENEVRGRDHIYSSDNLQYTVFTDLES